MNWVGFGSRGRWKKHYFHLLELESKLFRSQSQDFESQFFHFYSRTLRRISSMIGVGRSGIFFYIRSRSLSRKSSETIVGSRSQFFFQFWFKERSRIRESKSNSFGSRSWINLGVWVDCQNRIENTLPHPWFKTTNNCVCVYALMLVMKNKSKFQQSFFLWKGPVSSYFDNKKKQTHVTPYTPSSPPTSSRWTRSEAK